MHVILEKPINWLRSKRDGERNRLMYAAVKRALSELGQPFSEEPIYPGAEIKPRAVPEGSIRLSYHSIGNVKNVWRLKETPIPYFYGIDRLGYSGWSELAARPDLHAPAIHEKDEKEAIEYCRKLADWLIANNLSKYRQAGKASVLPAQFVFFPMQVLSDSVAVHNRIPPLRVLREAARLSRQNGTPLLVKRHPYCRNFKVGFWLRWLAWTNPFFHVTKDSVTRLLPACSAVLVGNSGVGLEALIHGKPVFSFAASEYELATHPIHGLADLSRVFGRDSCTAHKAGYRFVYYYLSECCFDARDAEDVRHKLASVLRQAAEAEWLAGSGLP